MVQIQQGVRLAEQCRFETGGPADYFAAVCGADELAQALEFARERGLRTFVFSGGSNLFFADAGFRGLVVRIVNGGWELGERELPPVAYSGLERSSVLQAFGGSVTDAPPEGGAISPIVKVSAGYDLSTLVREMAARGLGGIEFLGNIPGSVGGAVVGNAGCYGRAIASVFVEAEVYDRELLEVRTEAPEFFEFAYRHSKLKYDERYIILGVTLRLALRERDDVLTEVEGELASRLAKHPHFSPCAGSFFKNPPTGPAWRVIAAAGLADARVGGARLHEKHANFLVNEGGTAANVIALAKLVMAGVKEKLGLELEPEVRYVGEAGIEPI